MISAPSRREIRGRRWPAGKSKSGRKGKGMPEVKSNRRFGLTGDVEKRGKSETHIFRMLGNICGNQ